MSIQSVLLPVFLQVLLVFVLLGAMGRARNEALKSKAVKLGDVAISTDGYPAQVRTVSNAYSNQFEMPVLFYAVVIIAVLVKKDDVVFVVLEWLYVASRYAHAWVHSTSNIVTLRFRLFAIGALMVAFMWIYVALRVMLAG